MTAQNGPPLPPAENRSVDGSGNNHDDPTLGAPISLLERLDYSGIPGITGFSDLTSDAPTLAALVAAYPSGIASLDPFVGILVAPHAPGSSLGETGRRLFARQAEKTRDSDRFWYQNQLTFDPRLARALELLGLFVGADAGGHPILNRTWASVLVGVTAIGSDGFPLSAQSTAFFTVHP